MQLSEGSEKLKENNNLEELQAVLFPRGYLQQLELCNQLLPHTNEVTSPELIIYEK